MHPSRGPPPPAAPPPAPAPPPPHPSNYLGFHQCASSRFNPGMPGMPGQVPGASPFLGQPTISEHQSPRAYSSTIASHCTYQPQNLMGNYAFNGYGTQHQRPAPYNHCQPQYVLMPSLQSFPPSHTQSEVRPNGATQTHLPILPPTSSTTVEKEYRCEPCDKIFTSKNAHSAHVATHDKCSVCSFEGTRKVVAVHFQLTHGHFSGNGYKQIEVEGTSFKVLMGTDPKEVEEWRSQRRKKYPTQQGCKEKQAHEEKLLREGGISLSKKRSIDFDGEKSDDGNSGSCHTHIALHCGTTLPDDQASIEKGLHSSKKECVAFKKRGACRHGKNCHFSHDVSPHESPTDEPSKPLLKRKLSTMIGDCSRPPSLYSKLAQREVDKADNIILQCFRHIVKTEFGL